MEWVELITDLIAELGWPIAIIIVAVIFRNEIIKTLQKIKRIKYGALTAELSAQAPVSEIKMDESTKEILEAARQYNQNRVGLSFVKPVSEDPTLATYKWGSHAKEMYWLGHGLMYTKAVLLAGAPRSLVLFGLKQCFTNMKNLGFGKESNSFIRLAAMMVLVQKKDEDYLTIDVREDFAQKIQKIIYSLGNLIEDTSEKGS